MSEVTKKYSRLSKLFAFLSIMLTAAPVVVYLIIAFYNGAVHEKITLGITFIIAALLTIINLILKFHIRSILWIVILGIYFCLDNIMPLLLIVAIGTILDEFIITPLHKSFKSKANINKEIDKRIT